MDFMDLRVIFQRLSTRQIGGLMFHEQLMNYYQFLGLDGYAKCQQYHYISETLSHARLNKFAIKYYSILVRPNQVKDPDIIPSRWYDYIRELIEDDARKEAIEFGLGEWIKWESDSCAIYSSAYLDLMNAGEIAAAEFVKELTMDAEEELTLAKDEKLKKSAMNYDIVSILEEQETYEKMFSKKIRKSKE